MSFLGELAAILNIGNEIQKSRYVSGESPFDIHISSPQEAEYDLKKIRFIVAVEQDLYDYGNQTDKPEKTIVPIVRNVVHGDEILKGKAYLYTITNTKRISFAIHNIQFSDLSVPVDLARERWFHNEEREVQFLVAPGMKITKIEIDYCGKTAVYVNDPGHRRLVCIEIRSVIEKKSRRRI